MLQKELDDIKAFHSVYGTLNPHQVEALFQAVVVTDAVLAVEPEPVATTIAKPKRAAKATE
jgi:hypothetical protein